MNALAPHPVAQRRAVSPYARRLARERGVPLDDLFGSGPRGRIVAVDVLAFVPTSSEPIVDTQFAPEAVVVPSAFSTTISLVALNRLIEETGRLGLTIELADVALRALCWAVEETDGVLASTGVTLEVEGQQVLVELAQGLSIGRHRKARIDAVESGVFADQAAALISLQVLEAVRVLPVSMPLLPGRTMRLRLVADDGAGEAAALLCAAPGDVSERAAIDVLEKFAEALEQPLALLA